MRSNGEDRNRDRGIDRVTVYLAGNREIIVSDREGGPWIMYRVPVMRGDLIEGYRYTEWTCAMESVDLNQSA